MVGSAYVRLKLRCTKGRVTHSDRCNTATTAAPPESTDSGCRPFPESSSRHAPRRQSWPYVNHPAPGIWRWQISDGQNRSVRTPHSWVPRRSNSIHDVILRVQEDLRLWLIISKHCKTRGSLPRLALASCSSTNPIITGLPDTVASGADFRQGRLLPASYVRALGPPWGPRSG